MSAEPERRHLASPDLPPGRPRLVVTGFMGTGKTEAGRRAAARLGLPFLDLDRAVERRAGMTVPELFLRRGEPEFRRLERGAVREAARLSATVVATGGGAALDRGSFASLAGGSVVAVLTCRPEELLRRLSSGRDRPLLRPDPAVRVRELLAARGAAYRAAGASLDTTHLSPDEAAAALAGRYPAAAPIRVEVEGPEGPYRYVIGSGAIETLREELSAAVPGAARAAIVLDEAVDASLGPHVARVVEDAGLEAARIVLPAGEAGKTADTLGRLWSELRSLGIGRQDPIVAVGGGAALDTAGFAAATYARGIPLVNVPTTLLAMVDAALGGKVAVDHAGVKNLVGAFHHPRLVVADTEALRSLSSRELRAGLAEAVKAAVVGAPLALDVLEDLHLDDDGLPRPLEWVVEQSVRVKAAYVAADPLDRELRHALNLGHTYAHAVESATGYEVLHGEAVAMGTVAAARLGASIGACDARLAPRLETLLARFGLPVVAPAGLDRRRLAAAMGSDKKRRRGRLVLVVPSDAGGVELVSGLRADDALRFLLEAPAAADARR